MNFAHHAGRCCGVKHVFGFGGRPNQMEHNYTWGRSSRKLTQLKRYIRENGRIRGNRGKLFEVILTDGQVTAYPEWIPELKELDFKLVSRFNNSTGGWCNVFHKCTGNCRDDKVPDWWRDEPARIMGVK